MFKKYENMTDAEIEREADKVSFKIAISMGLLIGGYLIGRLTAVSDLQKGKLDEFIPKH